MATVAWSPDGYLAPTELLAVRVPQGPITQRQWWEALADRVTELAIEAGPQPTQQACRSLGTPLTSNPQEAGQFLVLGNLNLRTHLNLAMQRDPFPATAKANPQAEQAVNETDLESWVELALSLVSESDLD